MRMSISRKLVGGFLCLAILVLVSGLVGIVILNKVSTSADTVAKEKAPTQYAVMNAALAVDIVQKNTIEFTGSLSDLERLNSQIISGMDEFNMWINMLQFGTETEDFQGSSAYKTYQQNGLELVVPQSSSEMLPIVTSIIEESNRLKEKTNELVASHKKLISYGVVVDAHFFSLPNFLNLAQREHLEWTKKLKDAVNIETKFTDNTDPTKGIIGNWLETYNVENQELLDIRDKLKKRYIKLLALADKINSQDVYKNKQRSLSRGMSSVAKIERYFNDLHSLSKTIYTELEGANNLKQAELTATVENINSQLQSLINIANAEMITALKETASAKKDGITVLVILTIVAVIVAIILGTLVSNFMASKISSIADSTKKIADGDLQKDLDITSNDELGDLANDTNSMIANLREMIGQILSFSSKLTQSAEDLSGVSKDLDENTIELETRSTEASEATSTMNTSMTDISSLANNSMERVQSVAFATEEMSNTISEIAKNTEQARSVTNKAVITVEKTTLKMNELSNAATEIGKVADVIVSIAEQTNLLSLNATIEAARAGDAGKGFAVVANEVKELAGQTNKATEDIREKIAAIQQSSDMTISEITEITGIIGEINSIVVMIASAVEEQAVTTKNITDDIGSVSGGIEGMTEHVDSATNVSSKVGSDIDQVKLASTNIGKGSRQVQTNATELEKLSEELSRLVSQFKL